LTHEYRFPLPQTNPLRQKLIEQRQSDAFHSSGWMRILAETYNFDLSAYVLLDEVGEYLHSKKVFISSTIIGLPL